jgi:hypothetical protein
MTPPLCLSVRQPWAWAILNGKDIENRDWSTTRRGRFLLHASKTCTRDEYEDVAMHHRNVGDLLRKPLRASDLPTLQREALAMAQLLVTAIEEENEA